VWLIGIVVAIALAAVTLILNLQKWIIVIGSAILGAGLVVAVFTALFKPVSLLMENPVKVMLETSPLLLIVFLLLVIFGIVVQSRTTRKVAISEPSTPVKSAAIPAIAPAEAAPVAAAVGVAGVVAAAEEVRQEPVMVEPSAAVAVAAETPAEQPAPETAAVEPLAAGAFYEDTKVAAISGEDVDKFKSNLEYIEGIGPVYAAKLNAIGINNLLDLLEKGVFPKGREEIAAAAGISHTLVLKWVNHVDLFRIKGVGSEYADLLEMAGVDTVVELAMRNPANLFSKLEAVNEEKKLVRRLPALNQVQEWVEQAKSLPRKINY
jgi:predicted flap endonuclease-1-like 5' DNA nuclease